MNAATRRRGTTLRASATLLTALALTACDRGGASTEAGEARSAASSHSEPAAPDHGHESLPRTLEVEPDVVEAAGIRSEPIGKQTLAETLDLPGEIVGDPDRVARISSPAPGRLEKVKFQEGAIVEKGDVITVVRVPEIARIRAAHRAAIARAKSARSNATRLRELLAQRLAAEQDVISAEAEASAGEAEATALAEQLAAVGAGGAGAYLITLRAPISGIVVARNAVVGQPVTADQTLGTIADLDEVWFLGRVFEKDLGKLETNAPADVHLNAYPGQHFEGVIEYIGRQVDSAARTVTARVRLKNRDELLRIGLFGTAQVAVSGGDSEAARLVVPTTAVVEIGGQRVVFVETGEGHYAMHDVTLGRESVGKVAVLAGVGDKERVVTEGAFTLKSLVLKGSFAEEE